MTTVNAGLVQLGAQLADQPYARRGVSVRRDTVRVVLADDHAMIREGLRLLLRTAPDITVVGEADTGSRALDIATRLVPDVLVLDLDMPACDAAVVVRILASTQPAVRVLVLTVHAEQEYLLHLLEAGARGYLTKEAAACDFVDAIRVVASGDVYVRPTTARLLAAAVSPQRADDTARSRFQLLSNREQSILRLTAQGHSGVEIARQLAISTKTVDAYKRRIRDKLGLGHRTEYVQFAIQAGLLGV